jgi:PAS domain S-box-containing protein
MSAASDYKTELRERAEAVLRSNPERLKQIPAADFQQLVHDLSVHQVELEIQNEELQDAHWALQRARDDYAELFDAAPVGYVVLDEHERILRSNRTFRQIVDRPHLDLRQHVLSELVHPEDRPQYLGRFRAFFRSPEGKQLTLRLASGDGLARWYRVEGRRRVTNESRAGAEPERVELLLSLTDVTEQRAAEQRLRASEEHLATTLDSIDDCVITTDVEQRVARLNPAAERLIGWRQEAAQGRPLGEVLQLRDPDSGQEVTPPLAQCLESGVPEMGGRLVAVTSQPGARILAEERVTPRISPSGEIVGGVLVLRDVTFLVRTTEALALSEEQFRTAFEDANVGAALVLPDGRFLRANRALAQMLGYTPEALGRLRWNRVLHPEDLATLHAELEALETGARPSVDAEVRLLRRNGDPLPTALDIAAVRDAGGRVRHHVVHAVDLRELHHTSARLAESNAQLALRARLQEVFLQRRGEAVYPAVLDSALATAGGAQGHLGVLDEAGALVLAASSDAPPAAGPDAATAARDEGATAACDEGTRGAPDEKRWPAPWRRALSEQRLVCWSAARASDGGPAEDDREKSITDAWMAAPILLEQRPLGLLVVGRASGAFTESQRRHLERVAQETAPLLALHLERQRAEQKRAEAARRLARREDAFRRLFEEHRNLLDALPDEIVLLDEQETIRWANRAARQGAGAHGELLGRRCCDVFRPVEDAKARCPVRRCLREKVAVSGTFHYEGGRVCEVHVVPAVPARAAGEEAEGGVIRVSRDVTERTRLEQDLQQAQRMESVGRLAGGIAHDFNNLLTAILGNLTLAASELGDAHPVSADLQAIEQCAQRAAELVRQLLSYSRKQMVQPEVFDAAERIGEMLSLLERVLGEDVHLEHELAARPAGVRFDVRQFEQILINLAVNARDAMRPGDRLRVTLRAADSADIQRVHSELPDGVPLWRIRVADTGSGMEPEVLERIFEPFYTTKPPGVGTGMGLSMVYGAVRQNGGVITVTSSPGQGSRFDIYLPREELGAPAATPAPRARSRQTVSGGLLLVEDDALLRKIVKRTLTRRGLQVYEAEDGRGALRVLEAHPDAIHLMVSDVVMPHMDGGELARRARALRPALPLLFCSGYARDVVAQRGILVEGSEFLAKPYSIEELLERIERLLQGGDEAG